MVENGRLHKLLGTPNHFGQPGWASYTEYAAEPEIISQSPVSVCKKCRKEIETTPCYYCEENRAFSNETEKFTKYTLNGSAFCEAVGKELVKEKLSDKTIDFDDTKEDAWIVFQSPHGFKVGIVFFKGKLIGQDTFRQTVSKMTDEKSADYLVFLCRGFDESIQKILNFYRYARIDTYATLAKNSYLLNRHIETFSALVPMRQKATSPIFYQTSQIIAALEATKKMYAEIRSAGKSSIALGNEFEKQLIIVLNYLFTTFDVQERDRLPELLIFDYKSGYYLVDIKSGRYKIEDYRQMESYVVAYSELISEEKKSLKIHGVVIPHILWGENAGAVSNTFENFAKIIKPIADTGVQITLIDVEAIIRLAEAKPTMSNNAFTHLLLNVDKLFVKGLVSNSQL